MADMSDVLNVLTAIENYLIDLPMKIILKADQIFIVNGLSDVSENLGIITAGEFRSGNRLEPGKLFSGMRMAYPPMTYSASEWNLVGVNADVLQFGVRASDGKLLAGGGAVILDASGITATAGLIAGWTINTDHLLSDGTPGIKILSTGTIETSDFVSGILGKGWRISEAGDAEFNNAVVRGELRTTVLSYQEVQAVSGTMGVFQSAGVLRATYEIPAAGDATITVKDPEYGHAALFAVDDILWIKDGTNSTWLKVKVVLDNTTYYTYGCSIENGDREIEYTAGQAIVNFGVGGEGFLLMEAIGTGAPYFSVRTTSATPWTGASNAEHVRMGNLNGNWGYASAIYGVALGKYDTNLPNITIDSTNGLRIRNHTSTIIQLDASGDAKIIGDLSIETPGVLFAGGGDVHIGDTGIEFINDPLAVATKLKWFDTTGGGSYEMGYLSALYDGAGGSNDFSLFAFKRSGDPFSYPSIAIKADDVVDNYEADIMIIADHSPKITSQVTDPTTKESITYVYAGSTPQFYAMAKDDDLLSTIAATAGASPEITLAVTDGTIRSALSMVYNNINWQGTKSSWIDWYGNAVPVYVSALSIKFEGVNVANSFPMGTKLKVSQSSTAKYFYVISATFSTNTTLVLAAGSTGVTIHSSDAITGLLYSHDAAASISFGSSTFIPLTAPLTSTSWDGDSFSTTAKTLIDLSAVFGAPAGIKAVLCRVSCKDSGSAASQTTLIFLSPTNTANAGMLVRCAGLPNDVYADGSLIVPCDANGDIYYQTIATGAGTLDIVIQIYGYFI